jgi:hypothetical protein
MEWHGYSSEQVVLKNYLEHHGVKGQRWGVRRYQNADGSLTEKGKERINKTKDKVEKMYDKMIYKSEKKAANAAKKGKSGKQKTWEYIAKENKRAKAEKLKKIGDMNWTDFKRSRSKDRFLASYSQRFMDRNSKAIDMTSKMSRLNERWSQFGNRITAITTYDKVLNYISGEEGARYLNTKRIALSVSGGSNSGNQGGNT